MIGSISPFAIDATMFVGTSDKIVPIMPWELLCTAPRSALIFRDIDGRQLRHIHPGTGLEDVRQLNAKMMATVVITSSK